MTDCVRIRHRPNRGSLLILGLCLTAPVGLQADNTNTVKVTLEEVGREMARVNTVFTRFVQERHLSLFNEPLRSEGYLCCQKPGHVRWQTTAPYESILVSDGSEIAQFERMGDGWRQLELGLADAMKRVVGQIAAVVEGGYARNQSEFDPVLQSSKAGPVVLLKPKREQMRKVLAAIEVHLNPDLTATRRVILRETGGDSTDIRFEGQVCNLTFPDHTFDCVHPADLERIVQAANQVDR